MTDHVHGLTDTQTEYLLQAIKADRVKTRDNQSHVEAWDVRRTLIRAFGFGGYDIDRLSCDLVDVDAHPKAEKNGPNKGKPIPNTICYTVVYRYELRLTVKCRCGHPLGHYDEVAIGDAINLPGLGAAHDFAVKTAESQALKRAAINLGDQFGLSLYNKGGAGAVVQNTALHAEATAMASTTTKVHGGEMDEPVDDPSPEPENQDPPVDDWITGFITRIDTAEKVADIRGPMWQEVVARQNTGHLNGRDAAELGHRMAARVKAIDEGAALVDSGVSR